MYNNSLYNYLDNNISYMYVTQNIKISHISVIQELETSLPPYVQEIIISCMTYIQKIMISYLTKMQQNQMCSKRRTQEVLGGKYTPFQVFSESYRGVGVGMNTRRALGIDPPREYTFFHKFHVTILGSNYNKSSEQTQLIYKQKVIRNIISYTIQHLICTKTNSDNNQFILVFW